jgi:hypothetical protein
VSFPTGTVETVRLAARCLGLFSFPSVELLRVRLGEFGIGFIQPIGHYLKSDDVGITKMGGQGQSESTQSKIRLTVQTAPSL